MLAVNFIQIETVA